MERNPQRRVVAKSLHHHIVNNCLHLYISFQQKKSLCSFKINVSQNAKSIAMSQSDTEFLHEVADSEYKYGFVTEIEADTAPKRPE